ncbi:MAG: 3'-5' exonuclease [Archaeoglobaceae archaeon]|nr:3'-5' exonuclease [Archaeoglobaceae archaeon]MCX8151547.1 3'-5' exonuclease [Archaeoglobaceae archaeon]MDW8013217.1 3'-5' exonuclease [Archaeoglobaceae archaeon]
MTLRKTNFAVIDLETTGLKKGDEILAIAIVPMTGVKIYPGEVYYSLIRPKKFKFETCKFHGIDPKMLKDAPEFSEVAKIIYSNLSKKILVGYSVDFDYRILRIHLNREKLDLECKTLDVANLEYMISEIFGTPAKYEELTFESIAKKYGLEVKYRHNALSDAFITAQIFQNQLLKLLKHKIDSTAKLFEIYDESISRKIRFFC